jgi:hypothetical protein
MASLPVNSNQISENIYCNSESYNDIYDQPSLYTHTSHTIIPWVKNLLRTHRSFLEAFLVINTRENDIPLPDQHTMQYQENRRKLRWIIDFDVRQHQSILSVDYRFIFDYKPHPRKKYYINEDVTIRGIPYMCMDVLENNVYVFERRLQLFHITLHNISCDPPTRKCCGAFHMKIDSMHMKTPHSIIMPFRPFIIHPVNTDAKYEFFKFSDFETRLTDYFTTDDITLQLNELRPFVRRYTEMNHTHYIQNILGPVYDKVVTDVLNPLAQLKLTNAVIPIPTMYVPNRPVDSCRIMSKQPNVCPIWFGNGGKNGGIAQTGKKRRLYTRKNHMHNKHSKKTRRIR